MNLGFQYPQIGARRVKLAELVLGDPRVCCRVEGEETHRPGSAGARWARIRMRGRASECVGAHRNALPVRVGETLAEVGVAVVGSERDTVVL